MITQASSTLTVTLASTRRYAERESATIAKAAAEERARHEQALQRASETGKPASAFKVRLGRTCPGSSSAAQPSSHTCMPTPTRGQTLRAPPPSLCHLLPPPLYLPPAEHFRRAAQAGAQDCQSAAVDPVRQYPFGVPCARPRRFGHHLTRGGPGTRSLSPKPAHLPSPNHLARQGRVVRIGVVGCGRSAKAWAWGRAHEVSVRWQARRRACMCASELG